MDHQDTKTPRHRMISHRFLGSNVRRARVTPPWWLGAFVVYFFRSVTNMNHQDTKTPRHRMISHRFLVSNVRRARVTPPWWLGAFVVFLPW